MYTAPTNLVRVKTKYQVTLPVSVRKKAALRVGDLLEAKMEHGKITLVPKHVVDTKKAFIDAHLAEGLKDIAEGRTYGPFETAEDLIASLHAQVKKIRAARKSKRTKRG